MSLTRVLTRAAAAPLIMASAGSAFAQTTTTYSYDPLGRLTATSSSDGASSSYTLDAADNRSQVTRGAATPPSASSVSLTVGYNSAGSVALSPGGTYSSVALATGPSHGAASISGTTATYNPSSGYYGSDSFTYTASGPGGTSSPGNVAVTVSPPAAPTAGNVSLGTSYNTTGSAALAPSGVYSSLALATNPSHGSASIAGTTASYTPTSGYYGADSFTYTATGPGGTSSPGIVTVSVSTPGAPTVGSESLSVGYNAAGSVGLSPSGAYSSLAISTNPSHGSASISGTTATYTPSSGYYGGDSFAYTATGPGGTSSPATVTVSVATPAAPGAGNDSLSVAYNSSGSVALSPSGVYSSVAIVSNPAHGSASVSGTTASYTPQSGYYGSDSFTYTSSGPGGTSSPGTVTVSVAAPPAPSVGPESLSVGYNTSGSVGLSPSGVYSSLAIAASPSHGSASISGNSASYTPTSGYYGADSFTYTATGAGGTSSPATVSVTVGNPPAPSVGGGSLSVYENTAGSVSLSPSGVYTSLAIASAPTHGSASISGTTATYTPSSGYVGSDSFTYTASGPGGTSAPGAIGVTVTGMSVANSSASYVWNEIGTKVTMTPSGGVTATASGGVAPYSYKWTYVSGDTVTVVSSPTSATTLWTRTVPPAGDEYQSVWDCVVTDSAGHTATSPTVTITFIHNNTN